MALDDVPRLCGGQKISDHRDISGPDECQCVTRCRKSGFWRRLSDVA